LKGLDILKNSIFLSSDNSCRPQTAEGFAKNFFVKNLNIKSAGIKAHGLNSNTVHTMNKIRLDISNHKLIKILKIKEKF